MNAGGTRHVTTRQNVIQGPPGPGPVQQPLFFFSSVVGAMLGLVDDDKLRSCFRRRVLRLKMAKPDSCWSCSRPRRDLPRRSVSRCGKLPVPIHKDTQKKKGKKDKSRQERERKKSKLKSENRKICGRHWKQHTGRHNPQTRLTLVLCLRNMAPVMPLAMARLDFLPLRPHQALFPRHPRGIISCLRVGIRRRMSLVRRGYMALAGRIELVAALAVLEGDAGPGAIGRGGGVGWVWRGP